MCRCSHWPHFPVTGSSPSLIHCENFTLTVCPQEADVFVTLHFVYRSFYRWRTESNTVDHHHCRSHMDTGDCIRHSSNPWVTYQGKTITPNVPNSEFRSIATLAINESCCCLYKGHINFSLIANPSRRLLSFVYVFPFFIPFGGSPNWNITTNHAADGKSEQGRNDWLLLPISGKLGPGICPWYSARKVPSILRDTTVYYSNLLCADSTTSDTQRETCAWRNARNG